MATFYVRKTGNDANNGTTVALAKLTIASAITASNTNDTIDIGVGTWTENQPYNVSRVFQGAGMFSTIINTTIFGPYQDTMTINDMRINHTGSVNYYWRESTATMNRVYVDYSGITTPNAFLIYDVALTAYRCIFRGLYQSTEHCFYSTTGRNMSFNKCTFHDILPLNNRGVFTQAGGGTISVQNSIISSSTDYSSTKLAFYGAVALRRNNLIYQLNGQTLGTGEALGNPIFKDAAGGDFRIPHNSPAVGLGRLT
jgi:hypothetical protein